MKLKIKSFIYASALIAVAVFAGCEKNDKDLDYGDPKIYIPQSFTGAGLNYTVPKGLDSASRNYIIDTKADRVNVLLGVLRSGQTNNDAYSVTITTKADTINTLISTNVLTNTVLLPENMYKLPQTVSVPDGQSGASFLLSVDKTQLKANYTGKKVALAVVASNPTKYKLNALNNKVIVIIDVNALKL